LLFAAFVNPDGASTVIAFAVLVGETRNGVAFAEPRSFTFVVQDALDERAGVRVRFHTREYLFDNATANS
jgi:hypothetical protein